jgi:hypothetical protein
MNHDHAAAEALLRTGVLVPVRIVKEMVTPGPDEAEFALRLDLAFDDDESPEDERAAVVEWGAFGFLFVIGALSFYDARPRGASEIDFRADDEFRVGDFLESIRYHNGDLQFDADYLRGRRMKTRVRVRPDGTGFIETVGRGKSATHWIARLRGGQPLRAVDP